jgi:hypothetical protein
MPSVVLLNDGIMCHYAKCRSQSVVMPSVVMLNDVIMCHSAECHLQSVVMLSVFMLSVICKVLLCLVSLC